MQRTRFLDDCFWSLYNTTEQIRVDGLRTIQMQGLLSCLHKSGLDDYMIWQEGTDDWVSAESMYEIILEATKLFSMPPLPPDFEAEESVSLSQIPVDNERQILHKTGELARADAEDAANLVGVLLRQKQESPVEETPTNVNSAAEVQTPEASEPAPETPAEEAPAAPAQKKTDVRMSPRFMISFKVFLTYNGRVMKNETVNVSVGGMKLKTPLDVDAKGSVEVMLMHDGKELNMRCKILKDGGPGADPSVGASRLFIEKCNRMDILRTWILSRNHKPSG